MTWALWGKTRAQSSDALIYQGKNRCYVELIFESEARIFRVLRQRELKKKGGTTSLIFQVSRGRSRSDIFNQQSFTWKELTGPTIKKTQESIIKTLNLTYDIFINSSYLQQGKADEFTLKPPQQRKEILSQILNLDRFQLYEEKSREKLKEVEQNLQTLEFSLEEKKRALEELKEQRQNWQKIQKRYKKAKVELDKKQEAFKESQQEMQKLQNQQTELENLRLSLRTEVEEFHLDRKEYQTRKRECDEIKKIDREIKKLEFDPQKLEEKRNQDQKLEEKSRRQYQLRSQKQAIEGEKEKLISDLTRLKKLNICPTCHQKVSQAHFKKIAQAKKREFLDRFQGKFQKIILELKNLEGVDEKLNKIRQEKLELEDKIEKHSQLKITREQLIRQKETLPQEKERILRRKKQIEDRQKKIRQLEKKLVGFDVKMKRNQRLEQEVKETQNEYQRLAHQIGAIEEQRQQMAKTKRDLERIKQKTKEDIEQKALLEQLVFVFSQRGAPAQIISKTIPQIETEANRILEKATGGRMKVELRTKRAKKTSEGEIDTLDIIISDELGERTYELFSGGEAFRINFSIRVALSRLLSLRAGAKLKFLAIDEGFGILDNAGREDIIKAVKSVEQDFKKILVISHLDEIKDAFDQSIVVSKGRQGSRVEVID
jgi:exonuclease SbcC